MNQERPSAKAEELSMLMVRRRDVNDVITYLPTTVMKLNNDER